MEDLKLSFVLSGSPAYGVSFRGGIKSLEIEAFDGRIDCALRYDFHHQPLTLTAEAGAGDLIEVTLLPHRIALYVNGVLTDEEWPAGNRLFDSGDPIASDLRIEVSDYVQTHRPTPDVLSEFPEAEGWYPGGGVFVGDCMPYVRDGEYHVLYLKDRRHHRSKWGLGAHQWEHISTSDFRSWRVHPTAVPITDPSEGSICTGSWVRDGNKEYLYYTVRMCDGSPAPIRRSVSTDGFRFEKDEGFGFTLPERYHAASARDPKVIRAEDGRYHMFITTSLSREKRGCLAHFISDDLDRWSDAGEPIYLSPDATQPECPDYFVFRGRYYLVFSLRTKAHYRVSDRPFEGFREPKDSIIPCESVPKGAVWGDEVVFAGFRRMGGYGGAMTFRRATASETGELIFL